MSIEGIWHKLSISEVIESLDSGTQGLTREKAKRGLAQSGQNELAENKKIAVLALAGTIQRSRHNYPSYYCDLIGHPGRSN